MSRFDGIKRVQGIAHRKPLRTRLNCRRCESPLAGPRPEFDWLCPRCCEAEKAQEPRRDLTRRSIRPIR
jgi:hypothetical protein